jgi:HNH/ENDO VII superfamily nuclease
MGKGEIAKVFETLARDTMKAGKDTVGKLENFARDTVKRVEQNLDEAAKADGQAAKRITDAGKPGTGEPVSVRKDSRGRVIPPGVKRLPSGKLPANFDYAGKVYDGKYWTDAMKAKYPNGVRFTDDGFPDFSSYATHAVKFDPHFVGNTTSDMTAANRMAGIPHEPAGWVWHHHQDTQTMQLVPIDLHDAVRHAGGRAIMRGVE